MRTHTCGELTEALIGLKVEVCGWVDSRRDHGKLIFIDIRDRWGKLQVVFTPKPFPETYAIAKKLRCEDVIRIKGEINQRPQGTFNENVTTGKIELFSHEVDILNTSEDLPFPLEEVDEVGEETRFFHRYLDLRRPKMLEKFLVRHKFNQAFRAFLNTQDFLEIETPFLTKSTPEGARDFLVPSRLNPAKFYALPQSPQLFKQILMVSGMERYYQIVRCFRDEDLRRDRQPEFSQLDIEMSFIEEEDILNLIERMVASAFKEVLGQELTIPFPRMSYQEAMEKHGSDKPDYGEGKYRFLWVQEFPLFEYNELEQRWQSCHHPFTAPHPEDISLMEGELDNEKFKRIRARSYDLVLNGTEIASGSIRIHSSQVQQRLFSLLGITPDEAEEKFGFLLRALKYGAPPHGGIALGLDRMYAIITGSESIREVIAFPKTQRGLCLLSGAPTPVAAAQCQDLGIEVLAGDEGRE